LSVVGLRAIRFGVTYDINGRPAELFAKTARGLARAYDVDIPSHLIKAGLMLALGGRIDFGNQLWHRAVTSGLPNLKPCVRSLPIDAFAASR